MGQIMKKNVLLSFCLLCAGSLSACSLFSDKDNDQSPYFFADNEEQVIDATTDSQNRCGIDGISCNDSALINYTKTEADYRAYGERTPRDQLYTQAAEGNNLTATIRPDIEEDVVTEYEPGYEPVVASNDTFADTSPLDINTNKDNQGTVGHVDTIYGPGYEIVCTEECDDFVNMADNDDGISSEFTEDSFDIADYVKSNGDSLVDLSDGDDLKFEEIGDKNATDVAVDVKVAEGEITDDSVLTWDAKEGDTLRELLTKWSALAGWKLLWNTNRNYTLSAGVMFKGKFTDVSSALIRAFARARPAPIATFYKGNRVIVVETMENENAY